MKNMNRFWTLNKWITLGILGAFAALLLEIRFDHRHVLGEHWQAWAPLIYSGTMLIVGSAAIALWDRGGRALLFWGFAIALAVGSVGFWMHNMGQPTEGVERILSAWSQPITAEHEHGEGEHAEGKDMHKESTEGNDAQATHSENEQAEDSHAEDSHAEGTEGEHAEAALQKPPVLAPLAFFGLGLLGMLSCARRFQPDALPENPV